MNSDHARRPAAAPEQGAVFVFGSNMAGRHGAGAARDALRFFGATYGIGEGLRGESYALPTKDAQLQTLPIATIKSHVARLFEVASSNQRLFRVTRVGCGLAGYTDEEMAPLFSKRPPNVLIPGRWERLLGESRTNRVIIAGSRSITSADFVHRVLDEALEHGSSIEVVSGAAPTGVDALGEVWAANRRYPIKLFPAEWGRFRKPAGVIRNRVMSWYSHRLIAIWDGLSPGTGHMVTAARDDRLDVLVADLHPPAPQSQFEL